MDPEKEAPPVEDRRAFLRKCGEFAALTPPAVTFLLSTSMSSKAIAASSGRRFHGHGGGMPVAGLAGAAGAAGVAAAEEPKEQSAPTLAPPPPAAAPLAAPPPAVAPPATFTTAGERG